MVLAAVGNHSLLRELAFSAAPFPAVDAQRLGLFSCVVPDGRAGGALLRVKAVTCPLFSALCSADLPNSTFPPAPRSPAPSPLWFWAPVNTTTSSTSLGTPGADSKQGIHLLWISDAKPSRLLTLRVYAPAP
ncbi:hypothetical protein B0H13DRAFT_2653759 [Mycena leptocephala]|nr:hypothetical protein B0H13DRAFT_2653759 [Mycena leptocephala]